MILYDDFEWRFLYDDFGCWCLMMILNDGFGWWFWMMIVDADFVWWFLMMILNDGFGWWFWMMILDDDFGWWFLIMVFQKSIIPGRGPILAIFRFWFCFFANRFFFCIFLKKRIGNFRIWKSCTSITLTPKIFNNHTSKWPPAKLRFGAFSYVPTCMLEKKKTRRCLKPTFFHQTSLGATWYVLQIHTKSCVILYEFEIHARWHPRRFGGKTWVSNSNAFFSFQACMWEHRKMHGISIWRVVHFDVRLLNI